MGEGEHFEWEIEGAQVLCWLEVVGLMGKGEKRQGNE